MRAIVPGLIVGAVIALIGAAVGMGGFRSGRADRHTVRVTGESRLVGEPDVARVMFGVEKSGKTVLQAQQQLGAVVSKVIAAVEASGVKKEDVASSDLSISQGWDYRRKAPAGYDVSSTLTITVRNVQKVGDVIDAAVASGLNRLQGVSYDVRSPEWRAKGLQEALVDARQKAEAMAGGVGRKLGRVVSVQELGVQQASPAEEYYKEREAGEYPTTIAARAPTARSLPGQRAMTVEVAVEYEL